MNKRRSLLLCTKRRVQESNNLNLCNRCDETFHFPFPPIYFKFPKRFYGLISSSFQQDRISSARSGYGRVFPLRLHIAFNSSVKSDYWLLKKTQKKKHGNLYIGFLGLISRKNKFYINTFKGIEFMDTRRRVYSYKVSNFENNLPHKFNFHYTKLFALY